MSRDSVEEARDRTPAGAISTRQAIPRRRLTAARERAFFYYWEQETLAGTVGDLV